jgi:hypothetical protein
MASTLRPAEPMAQRLLAVELRYRIDVAMQAEAAVAAGTREVAPNQYLDNVRELVERHPRGLRSAHIQHNLGPARLGWLKEKGMIE